MSDQSLIFFQNSFEWPLLFYAGLVLIVVAGMIVLSHFLGERHKARYKHEIYESGIATTGDARLRFSSQYYIVAMFFVIFDIEAAFLIAWAISFDLTGWLGFTGGIIFIGILGAVLVYEWRIGALDYGPKGRQLILIKQMKEERIRNEQ